MTTHSFDVDEAIKYGMESAVLLSNIRYWLEKNRANVLHCHDGYYWTYNSAPAFNKLFPYISERSISRHLKNLCDTGVLLNANYNAMGYDRKYWYTIPAEFAVKPSEEEDKSPEDGVNPLGVESTDLKTRQFGGCTSQFGGCTSQFGGCTSQFGELISQNGAPIANINPDINPNTKTTTTAAAVVAVDNSLSEEQKACWKWAKNEKFWSGKVYSGKAFLSLYNAESGALKGQYENWKELNKTEEEKKVKPKVPEVWERQGFKSEKEYNDFMFKKQTEKYTKTKTGSLA